MGLVWTGQRYLDPRDNKTYIYNQRRVVRGTLTATQETAPGHESKLTAQTYFDEFDGSLIRPGCNCSWEERAAGHVCSRRLWLLKERKAKRIKLRRLR